MSNSTLTTEQYNILMEGSLYFEEFSNIGVCRSIDPRFLSRMVQVYNDFYHAPLNINCGECLKTALTKLWHHMQIKKGILDQEQLAINEIQPIQDEKKKRGRPSNK